MGSYMMKKLNRFSYMVVVVVCLSFGAFTSAVSQPGDSAQVQTLSLDVKDTDIRDVIRMISKGYGLNVILDSDVKGSVTLHLTDVPIIEGLNTLAESNGWELAKEGSVYRIRKPIAKKKSLIRYSRGQLTVDIQNINVVDFLKEISSKAAVSIVPDSKLSGKVSGKLYRVPLEDGLKAILEGNGYKITKRKNIYRVRQEESATGGPGTTSKRRRPRRTTTGQGDFYVECSGGYLNIDVQNGNLSDVVNSISEQCEIEMIIYGALSGEVNAVLNDIPLTEGLALLLGGTKFTFVQRGNVILIGDRNTATPSGKTLTKSELIHLKHIKADEVPKILPKNIPAANVKIIKEQNALLVSGTSEDIVKTREFLETIDIATPQVLIDVVVVEYTRDIDRDFGFQFAAHKKDDQGSNYYSFPEVQINRKGNEARYILGKVFGEKSFITHLSKDFFMTLRLLESKRKAKVLAQPTITVLNGNKATIDVGQTQYFKIVGGTPENPTHNFRPIKFGISLNITPWISKSGQITAEINPEISNSMGINEEGGYPNVFRRSVSTTVRIDDGKTLVLGGLLRSDEQVSHRQVPILGDIPIIGYLFKTTKKLRVQTNLVIYITPRIIEKDSYVNLEEELKQFDINERRGIFERRRYREINTFDKNIGIEDETEGELIEEDAVLEESENKIIDKQKDIKKPDDAVKSREGQLKPDETDSTPVKRPRKRSRRPIKKEPSDTTVIDSVDNIE